jgi:2-C-methyl-D-erythritol 4-phosphate cytidylyltransferase
MPRFAVILPAAGRSMRFQSAEKKVFADLGGRPVWLRSAELFLARPDVCQCILVAAPEDRERFAAINDGRMLVADGGAERFESVANALAMVAADADFIAVHDAARPCATPALIDAVFARAAETGAALLAAPVADTVKRDDGAGRVQATVPRQGLWLAQTPQVFRRDWLLDAYARRAGLGVGITDDAQLVEAAGHVVHLVPGSVFNVKITTREDLHLAEAILRALGELGQEESAARSRRPSS